MQFCVFSIFAKGGFLSFSTEYLRMCDTSINDFCNISEKVLKSNGIFLILPFARDHSTCEHEHVARGI